MQSKERIVVDDVEYVRADTISKLAEHDGMGYVIVRTYSAGVFAGYLASHKGKEVVIQQARRLWYWAGAASLSELAVHGVSKPGQCKFPCEVESVRLTEAIEILPATEKARKSIAGVKIWTA
jgi:hypothetical protein